MSGRRGRYFFGVIVGWAGASGAPLGVVEVLPVVCVDGGAWGAWFVSGAASGALSTISVGGAGAGSGSASAAHPVAQSAVAPRMRAASTVERPRIVFIVIPLVEDIWPGPMSNGRAIEGGSGGLSK